MTNLAIVDHILRQGKALVRAIEVLGTIEPSRALERVRRGYCWFELVRGVG